MKKHRYLSFGDSVTAQLMPWISGITFFLALVILCFGILYQDQMLENSSRSVPLITLEIKETDSQKPGLEKTLRALFKRMPAFTAQFVKPSEMKRGLEGVLQADSSLTYPMLLHVWSTLSPHIALRILREELKPIGLSPHYILHRDLSLRQQRKEEMITNLTSILVFISYVCFFVLYGLCLKTQLKIHRPVLDLLVIVGGTATYVRQQFYAYLRRSLGKSFWLGLFSFLLFFGLLHFYIDSLHMPLYYTPLTFWVAFLLALILTLIGIGLTTFMTVFFAVRRAHKNPTTLFA